MKKLFMAAAILSSVMLFTGCGGSGGDPKATLTAFFDAMGKKDIEAARKLATADSKSMIDMMEMGLKMAKDNKETDKFDKSRMEFGDAKIEGDKATVPVKDKTSGESTNFTLKKEDGQWKVAFDKSSIMQMATDKMSEKGGMDSLTNALDELKNVNIDSVKDGINKGIEALDSAKQVLEKLKTE
jgi:delta 1-pyrroline-5-carboxylate dehydrogenase